MSVFSVEQASERTKRLRQAKLITDRISMQLLQERKAALRMEISGDIEINSQDVIGRDLLTLLVRSNMATNIPETQRLSDEEVLARTFTPFVYSILRPTNFRSALEVPT